MIAMASQITSLTIIYSTVYSGADQKKTSKLRVTGLCAGNSPETGEFPAQMASNAENVSIWWRHHDTLPRDEMATVLFSFLKLDFIQISLKFVTRGSITNNSASVHKMARRWTGDKPLSETVMT